MKHQWGRWVYNERLRAFTIDCVGNGSSYEIDRSECSTPREVLSWLIHLADKTWCSPTDLGNLVLAMADVLPITHEGRI
jgi:hypothetical protein